MWRHNGSSEQDRLDNYWDAAVSGADMDALDQAAPDLDPNLLDTITRVRRLHRRLRPDPAFAVHLERVLMNAYSTAYEISPALPPARPKRIVTRPAWLPRREEILPRKWSLAAAASVALVAFTIAAFFFSVRHTDHPTLVPGTPEVVTPTAAPVTMYRGGAARTGEMPGPGPASQPQVLWRFQTNGEVHSIPAFADGVLYGGGGAGYLYAMDASSGEEIWQWFANGPTYSPAVVDGTVYVGAWDSNVYAIDAATGVERWHAPGLGDNSSPAIVDGVVYVGSDDGFVTALNASDGSVIWQTTMPAAIFRSVAIAEGKVFAGLEDGGLYALDLSTGNQLWSFATGFEEAQTASVVDGVVYVTGQAADNGSAFALNAADGSEIWRFATDTRIKFGAAEVSGGTVFLGDVADTVYAIDAATGAERWRSQVDDTLSGLPAMVDGVLYVGANQTLYAIDMVTGDRRWQVDVGEPFIGQVIVTGGLIYFGTGLGSYMAVGVGDGSNPVIHAPLIPTATVPATPNIAATPETGSATSASSPIADQPAEFLWETTGGDTGFDWPGAIALAPDGTVWVADTGNDRFQIFSQDGAFIESWGGPGAGDGEFHLQQTDGDGYGTVAFLPDGSFAVLDTGNLRIQVFGPDRSFQTSWGGIGTGDGQFVEPIGIAIDGSGLIHVLDSGRNDVQVFTADGTLQETIPLQSTQRGKGTMNGLAIDTDGNLYVSVTNQDVSYVAVEKFDRAGNLVGAFGQDSGPGKFVDQPVSMAIDANGNLFVAEVINNPRVVVFSPDRAYLTQFTATGSSNEIMEVPFGVALDGAGSVYVTDANQNRLVKLRLPESLAPTASVQAASPAADAVNLLWETTGGDGGFASPSTLAFAPDGNIWVADAGNARFQIFDTDGNFIESWTGTGDGQFGLVQPDGNPYGAVAFAADGSFYVLDPGARRVLVFSAERTFLRSIGEPGRGPGQFASPTSIGVDPAGNIAVLDPARRDIQTFAPDGTLVATAPLQSTHAGATSMNLMIIDGDGNFLVAEQSANLSLPRLVEKFDAGGNLLQQFGDESGPGSFGRSINEHFDDQPVGVGIDAAGNVYVTEIGNNPRVVVFSADGEYLMEIGAAGSATVEFAFPADVLLDDQGNIYVTDIAQNRLVKLHLPQSLAPAEQAIASPATVLWQTQGGDGGFNTPSGMALDPDGHLWVADTWNNRFQILDSDGNWLETWGEGGTGDGQFILTRSDTNGIGDIVFFADGSFAILDAGNYRIQLFDADRTFIRAVGGFGIEPGQFRDPIGLVIDSHSQFSVVDDINDKISTFAQDGTLVREIDLHPNAEGAKNAIQSLAIDAADNFYVTAAEGIVKYDHAGTVLMSIKNLGFWYMAIDAAGNIYVGGNPTGDNVAAIYVYAPTGEQIADFGLSEQTTYPFIVNADLVLDGNGNLYISDVLTHLVTKFQLNPPLWPLEDATPAA